MTHTLWRGDVLLGSAELAPMRAGSAELSGQFHPTPAFDAVWPVLRALQEAGAAILPTLASIPSGSPPEEIRARLLADPASAALRPAREAVRALGLVLRDANGDEVADAEPLVHSWTIPLPPVLPPEARDVAARDAASAGFAFDVPQYQLTVAPRRPSPSGG